MIHLLIRCARWLIPFITVSHVGAADLRAYQHGIDFVAGEADHYRLFWSSAPGHPPLGEQHKRLTSGINCEYFIHDIYTAKIDPQRIQIHPETVIALPEAQEPVSAARNGQGNILLTFEDGSQSDISQSCENHIQQRYQLFDAAMRPLTPLQTVRIAGGHSGHAAAAGSRFVIAYAEGWIDDGGVDGGGTGDDIHLDVIDQHGRVYRHRDIAVDHGVIRDGWPLVAGSAETVIVVWQRVLEGSAYANLMYAVYTPENDSLRVIASPLQTNLVYYRYDVQYLAAVQRFIVVGNYLADGTVPFAGRQIRVRSPSLFAMLLDLQGNVVDQTSGNLPCGQCGQYPNYTLVADAPPAIRHQGVYTQILYPIMPRGWFELQATAVALRPGRYRPGSQNWFPMGTDGVFLDAQQAWFINLSPTGLTPVPVPVTP